MDEQRIIDSNKAKTKKLEQVHSLQNCYQQKTLQGSKKNM